MTTSSDICRALAVKYQPPEWCLHYEVADDTGTKQKRYADAVAMSIWPSRGYQLHGFEVKVSRSDFLAEMKQPDKADAVGQFCDFWWLVTPSKLVDVNEVPPAWGLMELTGAGLRVKRQAPKREAVAVTRGFMAALLRRSQDMQQAHVRRLLDEGSEARQKQADREIERRTRELREKEARHAKWAQEFEAAFGQKPVSYQRPQKVADTIRLAESLAGDFGRLETLRNTASALVREIDEALPVVKPEPRRMTPVEE